MSAENLKKRLKALRKRLKRGDVRRIAEQAGVHPVWVSYVLLGRGTSNRVLQIAEQFLNDRGQ